MAITIKLNAVERFARGVNYDDYMTSYFRDFRLNGWPYILGGDSEYEGNQIVILDNIYGRYTKSIVMDGSNFEYTMSNHRVTGTLTSIALGTLGDSYRSPDSFTQNARGNIIKYAAPVEISGLSITGSDLHNLVSGLMNGGDSSEPADPSVLNEALAAEAQILIGSTGADTYTGTRFGDKVTGNGGNDVLNGAAGNDTISGSDGNDRLDGGLGNDILKGDAGNDRLTGGAGADDLTGGVGTDVFAFATTKDSTVALAGLDTIFDFSRSQRDRVDVSAIDASSRTGGDQAFTFIGEEAFSRTAGELRVVMERSDTYISGDINGDGRADFSIHLDDAVSLLARDFYL